jgi:hypothetical protein
LVQQVQSLATSSMPPLVATLERVLVVNQD